MVMHPQVKNIWKSLPSQDARRGSGYQNKVRPAALRKCCSTDALPLMKEGSQCQPVPGKERSQDIKYLDFSIFPLSDFLLVPLIGQIQ